MCGTPSSELTLTDKSSAGCACCAPAAPAQDAVPAAAGSVTAAYPVAGLTCGSCAGRVTSAVSALDGVTDVTIDLVAGGTSTVTVLSSEPVPDAAVRSAIEQAGYSLSNA